MPSKSNQLQPARHARAALVLAAAAALAACGGGGGGSDSPEPPKGTGTSAVAGGWTGAGGTTHVFVTAEGALWGFIGDAAGVPQFMHAGTLPELSGGVVTAPALYTYDFTQRTSTPAIGSGAYVSDTSLDLTITPAAGAAHVMSLAQLPGSDFDPAVPASMAAVVGPWDGAFLPGETGVVSVLSGGLINTVTSAGCSSAGTVTPRANENAFDVELTLGPTCQAPGATARGNLFVVGSGPSARLYMGVKTGNGGAGAGFIGTRP